MKKSSSIIRNAILLFFLIIFAVPGEVKCQKALGKRVNLFYLPLDERFTTRGLFLADAKITSFHILTPDESILSRKKVLPDMNVLLDWTENAAKTSDIGIVSAEMLLYSGLIASRISADFLATLEKRLQILEKIHRENPKLRLFVSSTVTRIPAYPSAEEEPDYYAEYGREIFQFSFYSHRYEQLKNPSDKSFADKFRNQIPPNILDDFLFTRFIEDWVYMTIGREQIRNNLRKANLKEFAGIKFEAEYESEMKDLFNFRAKIINQFLKADLKIERVFFPRHRPFEIGFDVFCQNCGKAKR